MSMFHVLQPKTHDTNSSGSRINIDGDASFLREKPLYIYKSRTKSKCGKMLQVPPHDYAHSCLVQNQISPNRKCKSIPTIRSMVEDPLLLSGLHIKTCIDNIDCTTPPSCCSHIMWPHLQPCHIVAHLEPMRQGNWNTVDNCSHSKRRYTQLKSKVP